MAYQHYNRLIAHWQPKIRQEGVVLEFGSPKRHKSLTTGAVSVAQFVANHLNAETNCYPISQKTIAEKLGLAKGTIGKALDELVGWGVFTRERNHYEKAYTYRLAITCPEGCERIEHHNTKSELATLPKKQATPIPTEQETPPPRKQATGLLSNRQLIETNKEINKEMIRKQTPCFRCSGSYEDIPNGNQEIIHSTDCAQLLQFKNGQAWNITQSQYGPSWADLDNRQQQIENYLSLARGKERGTKRTEMEQAAVKTSGDKFQKIIRRTCEENGIEAISPLLFEYLQIVHSQDHLTDSHIKRAVDYTNRGWTLSPDSDWRSGKLISGADFLEGVASNG